MLQIARSADSRIVYVLHPSVPTLLNNLGSEIDLVVGCRMHGLSCTMRSEADAKCCVSAAMALDAIAAAVPFLPECTNAIQRRTGSRRYTAQQSAT